MAEHPALAGRAQLSVLPEHGPGAAVRNACQRYGGPGQTVGENSPHRQEEREVEVSDLAIDEALLHTSGETLREAA